MKKTITLILFLIPFLLFAQKMTAFRNTVSDGYNFWLYTPNGYDSLQNTKPVIIFLHGNSLCGNDLSRVLRYGCLDALEMGRKIDAVIIAPQNPGGSWNPDKINNVLNWVEDNYSFDTNRIYVLGMSLGGYGVIDYVGSYPERIAAAMALCGGGTLKSYCGLNSVPLWILHGTADRAVPCSQSEKVIHGMAACGDTSLLRYTKLSGQNHSQLARAFYIEETYQWLFAHSRGDSVHTVNRDIIITPTTLEAAYQNVNRANTKIAVMDSQKGEVTNNTSAAKPSASSTSTAKYHTIKKGDTLSAIARRYHTSVSKLCKLNKMKETTILKLGRKLRVR